MVIAMQRITIGWSLLHPRMPERPKIFSNTREPEYRMTGICTKRNMKI